MSKCKHERVILGLKYDGENTLILLSSYPLSDGETDVALHLPVCGETVPRDNRASSEGVQRPPQHLLLQQDRHRRQSECHSEFRHGSQTDHALLQQ